MMNDGRAVVKGSFSKWWRWSSEHCLLFQSKIQVQLELPVLGVGMGVGRWENRNKGELLYCS